MFLRVSFGAVLDMDNSEQHAERASDDTHIKYTSEMNYESCRKLHTMVGVTWIMFGFSLAVESKGRASS